MAEVTLSSKNQIVVPREAREAISAKPGDKLLVVTRGDVIILMRKPRSHARAIRGIGKGLYPPDYVKTERDSWE